MSHDLSPIVLDRVRWWRTVTIRNRARPTDTTRLPCKKISRPVTKFTVFRDLSRPVTVRVYWTTLHYVAEMCWNGNFHAHNLCKPMSTSRGLDHACNGCKSESQSHALGDGLWSHVTATHCSRCEAAYSVPHLCSNPACVVWFTKPSLPRAGSKDPHGPKASDRKV